ncbi:hypothetical protein MNQ98_07445 [Paenibacillus sp. N3/727]|uniref:hypothetical protein n=1 Tax=Paenibacillus sp. N3/727 TaxID=2925845 RepID=UPI001F52BD75|nr:hypothetical protein [Paenibacillus sp. N3/727]UNK19854.1 hypothetical protein MNQ98_07445 [Paenibacillus sp. N3/727]
MKTVTPVESIENHKYSVTKLDALIFMGTLLFFPVFLPLGVLRILLTHRHNYRRGYNFRMLSVQLVISFIVVMFFGMIGYNDLPAEERVQAVQDYMIIFGIIFMVPVAVLVFFEIKEKSRFVRLMQLYKELILDHQIIRIHEIAERSRQKPKHVIDDLQYMIDHKLLPFGTVGNGIVELKPLPSIIKREVQAPYSAGENVININFGQNHRLENDMDTSTASESKLPKTMECPGCGAKTTINPKEAKECDYCGSMVIYA